MFPTPMKYFFLLSLMNCFLPVKYPSPYLGTLLPYELPNVPPLVQHIWSPSSYDSQSPSPQNQLLTQMPPSLELAPESNGPPLGISHGIWWSSPLDSATESDGPLSLELATDFVASPSPPLSESAYDTVSESEVSHMVWVLPNSGSRPCYNYGVQR